MNPRPRLQGLFPAPLVATAVLLAVLVLLTPVLLSNGQPAGIYTQAVLIVSRVPPDPLTSFVLRPYGPTVQYAAVSIRLATNFTWTGGFPNGPLNWSRPTNYSNVLALVFNTSANPIAVDLIVLYSVAGSMAYYVGTFAFYLSPPNHPTSFSIATSTSGTNLPAGTITDPIGDLPYQIDLADTGGTP